MLGVSLGVLILIVALSVINGSITAMRGEALKSVPHVTISSPEMVNNWHVQIAQAEANPEVIAAAPFIEGEAALRFQGANHFIRLRGVDNCNKY